MLAVIVPAVVKMLAPDEPMFAPAIAGVVRLIVPAPTLSSVPAVCVMSPPVVLPPVLVATASVPPEPVVIFRSAAVPVPPPAALTLICTAFAVASVVVIELPAFIVKLCPPAPSVLALIVTVPEDAIAPFNVAVLGELIWMLPPVRFCIVILPGLNGATAELPTVNVISAFPALSVVPPAIVMSPVPALRFAAVAAESFAFSEIFPLFVLTLAFTLISRPACMVIPTPALVIAMALVTVMSLFACKTTFASAPLIVAGAIV